MTVVPAGTALDEFRSAWTGRRMLDLLARRGGRLRIGWPVGVGKSRNIDAVVEEAVRSGDYDLVVVLEPTRRLLEERRWAADPPPDVRVVNLRPRPANRCGPDRDGRWKDYEARGLAALGRVELCDTCPHRGGCHWRRQYSREALQGARVVFATQAHLQRSPTFVRQLVNWTGAANPLTLLDEANFIAGDYRRRITRGDLERFVDTLKNLPPAGDGRPRDGGSYRTHDDWVYRADLAMRAPTPDLRDAADWAMPRITPAWALAVQAEGERRHRGDFRFVGYDLQQFGRSPADSRERAANGDLLYAAPPCVGTDLIVYSGTACPEFTRYRLGVDLAGPFDDFRFEHPDTRWYNIASSLATKTNFLRNAPQILDFFAGLVADRLRRGLRPLLVAKKCFLDFCAAGMEQRLKEFGVDKARVVCRGWDKVDLAAPGTVPLIHYGMIGTNLFEEFHRPYCLTGFYVTERIVDTVLQDVLGTDYHVPIRIRTQGVPRRRTAGAERPEDRDYDVHRLAPLALAQKEMDVVVQAVGRVRPYTRPREVITFQCSEHPQQAYTREFTGLGEARAFFAVLSARQRETQHTARRVQAARQAGRSQSQAAAETGLSLSTVKRYWRDEGGVSNPVD